MKKFLMILFVLLFLGLAACQPAAVETPAAEAQAADVEAAPEEETTPPTVDQVVALAESPVDYCLECHTDKEQLVALAKEEDSHEEESEGVG